MLKTLADYQKEIARVQEALKQTKANISKEIMKNISSGYKKKCERWFKCLGC